ncbi:TetR/AcrR family transcriptional regulator [Arthrobacter sp. MDT1-48-3]
MSANMYSMSVSARSDGMGLRERKRRRTRASLVATARRLTLEHGLNGFTVEQLCEEIGISRRTFFNYFPSKEDAVLGHADEGLSEELLADFVDSGRTTPPVPLLEALTTLFVDFGSRISISREEYATMSAVLHREPQLLARMFARAESKSQLLTELIATREGLPAGHPTARVATFVLGELARRSLDEFFAEGNESTYAQVFSRMVDGLRYLFPSPDPTPDLSQNQEPA